MIVLDGDTVVDNLTVYRLVGFNTPEIVNAACPQELRLAHEAKRRLEMLARGARIIPVPCGGGHNYGRACARMEPDPGPTLIREGLAETYICNNGRCPRRRNWC